MRNARPQPPEEQNSPKITRPAEAASGVTSVIKTMEFALNEMGARRSLHVLSEANQVGGFDCPSCAWPDAGDRHMVEFCENGAKAIAEEATIRRVTPELFAQFSVGELSAQSDHWLTKQGRLTQPMVLREGSEHYEPISWDDAFALIGQELKALDSPNEAVFYTSGRTSNEAAFLWQLFVRMYGTNNLPDCSNMCHESSGYGLRETIGMGKSTITLEELETADCILVIGQNPGTNHPRMLISLQKAALRGANIISVNPLAETGLKRFQHPQQVSGLLGLGTPIANLHLPVRINGDVALLKGLCKLLLDGNTVDNEFIAAHTSGFEELKAHLAEVSWEEIYRESGVAEADLKRACGMIQASRSMVICWAMGLTQHRNAVDNVRELVNLSLLRGAPRLCCVRGHSNVQGDRTMGIWERMDDGFLDRLGAEFQFTAPREAGFNTVEAIHAMHEGKAKVFLGLGGNFLSAAPDTQFTAEALGKCRLTVQISTKLNRSHLITGKQALILPCLGRTEIDRQASGEQFVTTENSLNVVATSKGVLEPASEQLRSEPILVAEIARAVLGLDWSPLVADYNKIRDHIERVVSGFEKFNERVRQPNGFVLDNPVARKEFRTATGKARFTVNPIRPISLEPGELLMMTIRTHDQFNTTVYGLDDRYRGIHGGRRVVLLNERDLAENGISAGDHVDLVSTYGGRERVAENFFVVEYQIPQGCAATYFPEANVLVPVEHFAEGSMTPASKSVAIRIRKR